MRHMTDVAVIGAGPYCRRQRQPYQDVGLPIPLTTFTAYGLVFQKRFAPLPDERNVA